MTLPDGYGQRDSTPAKKKWGKRKKIVVGIGIGVFSALMLGLGLYLVSMDYTADELSSNTDTSQNQAAQSQPAGSKGTTRAFRISGFDMTKRGPLYQVYFQLTDANLQQVASDAHVDFAVLTVDRQYDPETVGIVEDKAVIYETSFDVGALDYDNNVLASTGAAQGEMYTWSITAEEIDGRADSATTGEAQITLTLPDGEKFTAYDSIFFD